MEVALICLRQRCETFLLSDKDEGLSWPEWRQEDLFDVLQLDSLLDGSFLSELGGKRFAKIDNDGGDERKMI